MRHQRPVRGGRDPLGASVLKQVRAKIETTARRYDVSRSYVVATILAEYFNIDSDPLETTPARPARVAGAVAARWH